jgi:hypothetical protein
MGIRSLYYTGIPRVLLVERFCLGSPMRDTLCRSRGVAEACPARLPRNKEPNIGRRARRGYRRRCLPTALFSRRPYDSIIHHRNFLSGRTAQTALPGLPVIACCQIPGTADGNPVFPVGAAREEGIRSIPASVAPPVFCAKKSRILAADQGGVTGAAAASGRHSAQPALPRGADPAGAARLLPRLRCRASRIFTPSPRGCARCV